MIRSIFPVAAVALVAFAVPAQAAEVKKFTPAEFAAAQGAGKAILVDVKAPWCPVCASQHGTIQSAIAASKFDKLTIFEIDYDTQKDAWRALGVHKQGTLIAYKGKKEVSRLEFQTDKTAINNLLAAAVN
ncbi:MAG: thiol reductase thioredoxin [Proteobacteria bacterium SG_bin6]|nr:MAG: thiol reductase thioredoxin [Proteobacteria bacterium SG_bin6]